MRVSKIIRKMAQRHLHPSRPLKVVHLPTSVGGMSWGLAQGEKSLGLHSEVLVLFDNWLEYPADRVIFKIPQGSWGRRILGIATRIKEVYRIRRECDVFHFNFGTSLIDLWNIGLPLLDLPFYRGRGKIVVTYNGCDARQKYPTMQRVPFSACHNDQCYDGICNSGRRDRGRQRKIAKFDHYADAIFTVNPDLKHFLPERTQFLPYTIANWDEIQAIPYQPVDRKMKILHSPTNRAVKGSDIIIDALNRMKERYGEGIDVMLVEGMPNQKARQVYARADLGIDQILIGWYGGFAVEMMKMGKPVMTFIRKEDLKFIPEKMARDCQHAMILVDRSSIFEKLCEVVENPSILKSYREAGLEYVHKWHDPVYVAGMTKSVYES